MRGKTIAVLESRFGEHLAGLLEKQGARVLRAPALAEEPDVDPDAIRRLVEECTAHPLELAIFQTGVGTRALFDATDSLGLTQKLHALLEACRVVVRGPKPTAVLRGRSVRMDFSAAEPFTTAEVLEAIGGVALENRRVLVQRYGDTNAGLEAQLQARGAQVIEVPLYRWTLPKDITPLQQLIEALKRREIDAVVFTSASQVRNLFSVAGPEETQGMRDDLNAVLVASIGPVCSEALRSAGVKVGLEASPPKLGPLIEALGVRLRAGLVTGDE
jgi:uroporphyrinogen-III synthase